MERENWLDAAKGLAIILVVLGHCLNHFDNESFHRLCDIIYLFHMPLFVFLSGYSFYWVAEHKSFSRNVLDNAAIYVIQSVIYIIFNIYLQRFIATSNHYTAVNFLTFPMIPVAHFWYIQAILIYYCIFWLCERLVGNMAIRRALEAAVAVLSFVLSRFTDNTVLFRICYHLLFFTAGYFLHLFVKKMRFDMTGRLPGCGAISYLGINSLWIYIFHPYVTSAVKAALGAFHVSSPLSGLMIMLVSALVFPLLLRFVMIKTGTSRLVTIR